MRFALRRKLTDENILAYEPTDVGEPKINIPSRFSKIITNIEDKIKHAVQHIHKR